MIKREVREIKNLELSLEMRATGLDRIEKNEEIRQTSKIFNENKENRNLIDLGPNIIVNKPLNSLPRKLSYTNCLYTPPENSLNMIIKSHQ